MPVPDHYSTLHISPGATLPEIKKAYRQLAQQFHPDKTNDDPDAAARFAAVKEAYETLSTPWKRQRYLEERWYLHSRGETTETIIRTPSAILQQALKLEKEMAAADVFRMNSSALLQEMELLLNDDHMDCLRRSGDTAIHHQLVWLLCRPLRLLTPRQAAGLLPRLEELAGEHSPSRQLLNKTFADIRSRHRWQQLQWLWIPVAIGILYLLIRFTGK